MARSSSRSTCACFTSSSKCASAWPHVYRDPPTKPHLHRGGGGGQARARSWYRWTRVSCTCGLPARHQRDTPATKPLVRFHVREAHPQLLRVGTRAAGARCGREPCGRARRGRTTWWRPAGRAASLTATLALTPSKEVGARCHRVAGHAGHVRTKVDRVSTATAVILAAAHEVCTATQAARRSMPHTCERALAHPPCTR